MDYISNTNCDILDANMSLASFRELEFDIPRRFIIENEDDTVTVEPSIVLHVFNPGLEYISGFYYDKSKNMIKEMEEYNRSGWIMRGWDTLVEIVSDQDITSLSIEFSSIPGGKVFRKEIDKPSKNVMVFDDIHIPFYVMNYTAIDIIAYNGNKEIEYKSRFGWLGRGVGNKLGWDKVPFKFGNRSFNIEYGNVVLLNE